MKRLLILLTIAFLTFSSCGLWAAMTLIGLKPGDPPPDFQIRTIDGKEITLSNLKKKIVILAFWKRGQDYSVKTLPGLPVAGLNSAR